MEDMLAHDVDPLCQVTNVVMQLMVQCRSIQGIENVMLRQVWAPQQSTGWPLCFCTPESAKTAAYIFRRTK